MHARLDRNSVIVLGLQDLDFNSSIGPVFKYLTSVLLVRSGFAQGHEFLAYACYDVYRQLLLSMTFRVG